MNNLTVVLVNINCFEARAVCERIENMVVDDFDNQHDLATLQFEEEPSDPQDLYQIFPISDFMDACNNQEVNLENWFVSYVIFEPNA